MLAFAGNESLFTLLFIMFALTVFQHFGLLYINGSFTVHGKYDTADEFFKLSNVAMEALLCETIPFRQSQFQAVDNFIHLLIKLIVR